MWGILQSTKFALKDLLLFLLLSTSTSFVYIKKTWLFLFLPPASGGYHPNVGNYKK